MMSNLIAIKIDSLDVEVIGIAENRKGDNINNTKKLIYKESGILKYANIPCKPGDSVRVFGRMVSGVELLLHGYTIGSIDDLVEFYDKCLKDGVTAPTLIVLKIN